MPSIGETLREARMRQRLDIADVEERTKIRAKYLRALENEEFGLLPGSTFARTFLRTYAEVLGLDPHVLVEEYRTNYEQEDELEVQALGSPSATPPPLDRERRYTGGPPSRLTVAVAAGVLVLAFLLVLGLTGGEDDDDRAAQTTPRTETAKRPATPGRKRKPPPAGVTLQVRPSAVKYICADRGPGTTNLFNETTTAPQTFKGKKLRVRLGNTQAVELVLNGRSFPLQPSADPVNYEFSVTGSKQIPDGTIPCPG